MPSSFFSARAAQPSRCESRNNAIHRETFMKLMLAIILLLSVSACALVQTSGEGGGNGGKAGGDTVVVCHKGKKTLELPRSAAQAHLDHGDRRGPC
jgi:hypothetical protein